MVARRAESLAQTDGSSATSSPTSPESWSWSRFDGSRVYHRPSTAARAGYFTSGLVEGMDGYGDVDQDGVFHPRTRSLRKERVKQLSGGTQHPPSVAERQSSVPDRTGRKETLTKA